MTTSGLELGADEIDLLIWNISNEVINGLRVDDFENRISVNEPEFKDLSNRLRALSEKKEAIILDARDAQVLRNALFITLEELGTEEFHTRTGHEFVQGQIVLDRLDSFRHGSGTS
jgi:hypothetical protein